MKTENNKRKQSIMPFDDAFRTLMANPFLLLNLINEIFRTDYPLDETVEYLKQEFVINHQESRHQRIICDSHVIVGKDKQAFFHLECQAFYDSSILLRMYEYDSQIALMNAKQEDDVLLVTFPRSGVLYLNWRPHFEKQTVTIRKNDSYTFAYEVFYLAMSDYSTDELIEKKLYALLPFFFFTCGRYPYDNVFKEKATCETFRNDLIKVLTFIFESFEKGLINAHTYLTLKDVVGKIVIYLCADNETVRSEVMEIMGGTAWEIEEIRKFDEMMANREREGIIKGLQEGRQEGLQEGRQEGKIEGLQMILNKLIENGKLDQSEAAQLYEEMISEKMS